MTVRHGRPTRDATTSATVDGEVDPLVHLAELLFATSRKLRRVGHEDPSVVALTPVEALVMQHIDRSPGTSPSRVAVCVGLKGPNASAAIRALVERGFVRREVDPDDGRAVRLFPTRLAAENLALMHAQYRRVLDRVVSPGDELAAALDVLSRLDAALDAAAEACDSDPA